MSSPKLCWLDCDPGHDDSFAIILAAYSPNIKLIGISTVGGNQTVEKTNENALNVMNLAGLISKPVIGDGENFDSTSMYQTNLYFGLENIKNFLILSRSKREFVSCRNDMSVVTGQFSTTIEATKDLR